MEPDASIKNQRWTLSSLKLTYRWTRTGANTRFMPTAGDRLKCGSVLLTSFRTRGTKTVSKAAVVINPNVMYKAVDKILLRND